MKNGKIKFTHPHGCPNFGKRSSCPPKAPLLEDIFDLSKKIFVIWNAYSLRKHVDKLRARHPNWSDRQLYCCLYWQGQARKQLRKNIARFLKVNPGYLVIQCPEACGINVTETMAAIGIQLEWPPIEIAYQIALAGESKKIQRLKDKGYMGRNTPIERVTFV